VCLRDTIIICRIHFWWCIIIFGCIYTYISCCTLIGQQYDTLRGEQKEKNGKKYRNVCLPHVTFVKVFRSKHTENKLTSKTTYSGHIGYKVVYRSLIYQTGLQKYPSWVSNVTVPIKIITTSLINNNNSNNDYSFVNTCVGMIVLISMNIVK